MPSSSHENCKVTYNGAEMTEYEASQKQRAYERRIRATKRELSGLDAGINETDNDSLKESLQAEFNRKSVLLKRQEAALKNFTHQTGLARDRAREQVPAHFDKTQNKVVSFNKSVSQKAVWANKKALQKENERSIIIAQERERALREIGTEKYPLEINVGNQNKHIKNSHSYKQNGEKSYIYGDLKTAQELVNKYSKTGELKFTNKNVWSEKEFVNLDYDVGVVVNHENGTTETTNRFAIHYGKRGTHVVPRERKK